MPGRQDAQLVRRTLGIRTFAAEGAGAAGQVAGQRVHLRSLVVAGVVMIAPERRAQAVVRYLTLEHDVPLYRIHVMGFGSESPVADNKSRDGRQQNRRVEVSVYKAGMVETNDIPSRQTSQNF